MFEIVSFCLLVLALVIGILRANSLDSIVRQRLLWSSQLLLVGYALFGFLSIIGGQSMSIQAIVTVTFPLLLMFNILSRLISKRRAGEFIATSSRTNFMLLFAPLMGLFLLYLIPQTISYINETEHSEGELQSLMFMWSMTLGMGFSYLISGLQGTEIRTQGVLYLGGLYVWGDFQSYLWQRVRFDETKVQLILVRKSWLQMSPNMRCQIRIADQEKVDALVSQYLPYTFSQSTRTAASS